MFVGAYPHVTKTNNVWLKLKSPIYQVKLLMRFFFNVSQPRILMAMARDGLLPQFFSDINKRTQVPVKGTIATGLGAAVLAFTMEVSELAGMVRLFLQQYIP